MALSLPSTYAFQGMRQVMESGVINWGRMELALGLNLIYMALGGLFFGLMLRSVRIRGCLARQNLQ